MYWTYLILGTINSSTLNGANVVTLLSGLNRPSDIVLHQRTNKMYWLERYEETKMNHIRCAKLDGSNVVDILTGLNEVTGIVLQLVGLYDVTPSSNKLTTTWTNVKTQ